MNNCLLSVIVPVYNCGKYLEECVESILHQNFSDMELILVDDGSTDGSGEICDKISKSVSEFSVSVIHKKNGGVSSARNAGIASSKGEYVALVDADDTLKPGMFGAYADAHKQYDGSVDLIVSGNETLNANGRITGKNVPKETRRFAGGYSLLFEPLPTDLNTRGWLYFYIWNKWYKRDILIKNSIRFNEDFSFGEDFLFNASYFPHAESIVTIADAFYQYRNRNSEHATSKFWAGQRLLDSRKTFYEASVDMYKGLGLHPDLAWQLEEIEARQIYAAVNRVFSDNCPYSKAEKIEHIKMMLESYEYGHLISKYPEPDKRIKMLVDGKYEEYLRQKEIDARIAKAKTLARKILKR